MLRCELGRRVETGRRGRAGALALGLGAGILLVAVGGACAQEAPALLAPGQVAPVFKVTAHDGSVAELARLRGKWVALYFYPRDDTPGCTKQACSIRDGWPALQAAGVMVFGVSTDGNASHVEFARKHQLPFPLLPDEAGELAAQYRVPVTGGAARRITYLIDPQGKIAFVWDRVDVGAHATQILDKVAELKAASPAARSGKKK